MTQIPDGNTMLRVGGTVLLIAAVLPFVVFAVPGTAGADHSYVVMSSSMRPTFDAGDVVIVDAVSPDRIGEGDVITFHSGAAAGGSDLITHRVIEVVERDDGRYFRTQGDANDVADRRLVAPDAVVGRMVFAVPYIGHVIVFAGSTYGFVALVVLPFGLLGLLEIRDIVVTARRTPESGAPGGDE